MGKDMKTINEIIEVIGESKLTELSLEEKDFKLFVKKSQLVIAPKTSKSKVKNINKIETIQEDNIIISKNVGRFYYLDKDEKPMMEKGDKIKKGQKIGYVEAMGIKTDVTSQFDGKIKEILISNGNVAEYGKKLVKVEKN